VNVILPEDLAGVFRALEEPGARILAGGTDLLVRERVARREGRGGDGLLIGLERIAELRGVTRGDDGSFRVGATTTFAELLARPEARDELRILGLAAAEVGAPALRNMATIGGNIVTASPAADSFPALAVLDASVELASASGVRRLPLSEFVVGPGRTTLRAGEALTAVIVPPNPSFGVHHFEKVGRRSALSIAVVSLAALLRTDARGRVDEARLAWGSVSPVVRRLRDAEAVLIGRKPTRAVLERAATVVRREISPIDDIRAGAAFRREVAGNLLTRLAFA